MLITVDAHVHNDRCEMTSSWVLENCLWVFRKQKAAFGLAVALLLWS